MSAFPLLRRGEVVVGNSFVSLALGFGLTLVGRLPLLAMRSLALDLVVSLVANVTLLASDITLAHGLALAFLVINLHRRATR